MKPYPAGSVGRYRQLPDADRDQSGLFAEALLGICSRRAADIAARAEGEPERLGSERGIRFIAEPHNQRNPANDVVPIGILVEEAISGGRSFQRRQVRNRRRKAVDMAERVVPGKGKAGLRKRRPGFAAIGQNEPVKTGMAPIASASR